MIHITLTSEHQKAMLSHIQACFPEEACGLLGGHLQDGCAIIKAVIPVENEIHSPVRFRMAPLKQLQAFLWLEEQGLELAAIFHSHPTGPAGPSPTDLSEFAYPGVAYIIWSPDRKGWQMRGFMIEACASRTLPVDVTTE